MENRVNFRRLDSGNMLTIWNVIWSLDNRWYGLISSPHQTAQVRDATDSWLRFMLFVVAGRGDGVEFIQEDSSVLIKQKNDFLIMHIISCLK